MTQSGLRFAPFVLICAAFAAVPAAARPGGGGGWHGGGGGGGGHAFSVPHAAPHISAPHISAPHVSAPHISAPRASVPHIAPRMAAPRISGPHATPHIARLPAASSPPHVAPQRVARPVQPPITAAGIPSARNLAGTAGHIVTPANQAGRAFALAGAHGAVSGHVLRNPFVANRPALARATFSGRFAQLPWRHRHLRPIVIGWFGPLFWPYAYDDFLGYTFYPYAYDTFWPYAYDDVYDGMFGLYDSGIRAAYAAIGRQVPSSGGRAVGGNICSGQTAGVTDWQINEIAQAVAPDDAQRAALDELKAATAKALDILKAACPTELASTPTGRIEAMHARLAAMLEAVRTVRAPLAKFYDLLSDEQKARFNTLGSGSDQDDPQARRDLTWACNERAAGIAGLPIERIERAVQPDEAQRTAFRDLQNAISEAGELLKSDCPTYKPLTPVVRLDAMEQRLDAMLRAVDTVQPALAKFYGSLSNEQKERFNQLRAGQG